MFLSLIFPIYFLFLLYLPYLGTKWNRFFSTSDAKFIDKVWMILKHVYVTDQFRSVISIRPIKTANSVTLAKLMVLCKRQFSSKSVWVEQVKTLCFLLLSWETFKWDCRLLPCGIYLPLWQFCDFCSTVEALYCHRRRCRWKARKIWTFLKML